MSERDRQQDSERQYWERHAAKYDLSLRPLGRPLPRMLELVAEAVSGRTRVLEVAAGTGLVTPVLAKAAGEVVATDYAAAMVARLQTRVRDLGLGNVDCQRADIYALPFESASFDAVVAANILHLVPDFDAAIAALRRVLRPGGVIVAPTFCHDEDEAFLAGLASARRDRIPGAPALHGAVVAVIAGDSWRGGAAVGDPARLDSDWLCGGSLRCHCVGRAARLNPSHSTDDDGPVQTVGLKGFAGHRVVERILVGAVNQARLLSP